MMAARTGRPFVKAAAGTRVSLGLKVTSETKRLIESAAEASGRTQSQEAEYRICQSFDRDREHLKLMGSILSLLTTGEREIAFSVGPTVILKFTLQEVACAAFRSS
jgi:hypothetical protein